MRAILIAVLMLTGCETATQYGQCVGVADEKDPHLLYSTSVRNAILGVVFSEMIVPPIVWLASDFACPVGIKQESVRP